MFAQPTARIVWPILWFFAAPFVAMLLWQIAVQVVSEPGFPWGIVASIVIFAGVASLPVLVLRRSMREGHTAGAVLAVLSLGWALLVALAITAVAAFSVEPQAVIVDVGPAPAEQRP